MMFFKRLWIVGATVLTVASVAEVPKTAKDFELIKGAIGTQSGNYDFTHFDKGILQKDYLDWMRRVGEKDAAYFQSTVQKIEEGFRSLGRNVIFRPGDAEGHRGGLKWMSDQFRASGRQFSAADFLSAINEYDLAEDELRRNIEILTDIANGAIPSHQEVKADGSGLKELPNFYAQIKFGNIKAFYDEKLKGYRLMLANLPQAMVLKGGKVDLLPANSGRALAIAESDYILPKEEIERLRGQVREMRRLSRRDKIPFNELTDFVVSTIQGFRNTYKERYRKIGADERAELLKDAARIEEIFWARSYLRAAYGMQIGGIGINYQKAPFHLDLLTVSTESLDAVTEEKIWDESEFIRMKQNYRNALARANERSTPVDGDLSSVWSVMTQVESAITYIGGNRNLAQALQAMLNLMAADFYEETLIAQVDGVAKMKARYRQRWLDTPERKAKYIALRKAYDPKEGEDLDVNASVLQNRDTAAGEFFKARDKARDKEIELHQARELEKTIAMAMRNNEYASLRSQRIDELEN